MDDQGDAHGMERLAGQFGARRGGGRGKRLARDVGEADAGLLEDGAVLHHAGASAAALGPRPAVLPELAAAVRAFQRGAD